MSDGVLPSPMIPMPPSNEALSEVLTDAMDASRTVNSVATTSDPSW
jgi:hypothetical protein